MSHIRIELLPREQLLQVRALLEKSPAKPHRFILRDVGDQLDSFWMDEIADMLRNEGSHVLSASMVDGLVGLLVYADLPWETRVFGKRAGELKTIIIDPSAANRDEIAALMVESAVERAASAGIEFLSSKVYTDNLAAVHALERAGFRLMDTQLDYVYDAQRYPLHAIPRPPSSPEIAIRLARDGDKDRLMEVARVAFQGHFGRFHADPNIPIETATAVYVEWITSALAGYADWCVVAEVDGLLAGYSLWKKPSPAESKLKVVVGHYSIAATHPDYAGRGLFGLLTYAGMELLNGLARCIEGPTHVNNYPVQRGYDKLHWQICDARHSFHKWLRK